MKKLITFFLVFLITNFTYSQYSLKENSKTIELSNILLLNTKTKFNNDSIRNNSNILYENYLYNSIKPKRKRSSKYKTSEKIAFFSIVAIVVGVTGYLILNPTYVEPNSSAVDYNYVYYGF